MIGHGYQVAVHIDWTWLPGGAACRLDLVTRWHCMWIGYGYIGGAVCGPFLSLPNCYGQTAFIFWPIQ